MKAILKVTEEEKAFLRNLLGINDTITKKYSGEAADNFWELVNDIVFLKKDKDMDISDLVNFHTWEED